MATKKDYKKLTVQELEKLVEQEEIKGFVLINGKLVKVVEKDGTEITYEE